MDWPLIATIIGTSFAVIGVIYSFLRNFKTDIKADINAHIDRLDARLQQSETEWKQEMRKMDQRVLETNKRMDGVYHLLLSRLSPKTEP